MVIADLILRSHVKAARETTLARLMGPFGGRPRVHGGGNLAKQVNVKEPRKSRVLRRVVVHVKPTSQSPRKQQKAKRDCTVYERAKKEAPTSILSKNAELREK